MIRKNSSVENEKKLQDLFPVPGKVAPILKIDDLSASKAKEEEQYLPPQTKVKYFD